MHVDFSSLCEPWYNVEHQEQIDPHCVKMACAAMVHFGLNPGKLVRWMVSRYTGYHCDVQQILAVFRPHIKAEDYGYIERILLDGCPAKLKK